MLMEITKFLRETKMAEATFGRLVANDPRLVTDIRNGRVPRERLAARIRAFMAAHSEEHSNG